MTARLEYAPAFSTFITPRGNDARMYYRQDTNDWNTIFASMNADAYHLKGLPLLTGLAVDIGAYIGSVGIALVLDNPDLDVICIEPVPENIDLIRQNVKENGLEDRITVKAKGAAGLDVNKTTVRWRFRGSEIADHHAFVGNTALTEGPDGPIGIEFEEAEVDCVTLWELTQQYGSICFLKIDCEGCEWSALNDPAVAAIPLIVGEWHPTNGHVLDDVRKLLGRTHVLEFEGPEGGPGEFRATLRNA